MAVATKTAITLQASSANNLTTLATLTSTTWTMITALGGVLTIRIVTGTAPTAGAIATVNVSHNSSTFYKYCSFTAGITLSTTYDFVLEVPPGVMYLQVVFTGANGQSSTVSSFGHELTSIQ